MDGPRESVAPTQLLLRALIQTIDDSRAASTHLRETDRFLDALQARLRWYDALLHRIDVSRIEDTLHRAAIGEVGWLIYNIIEYVKGLCEGTTDRIPFAFATLLNHELRKITGTDREIALFPVDRINYFYVDVGEAVIDRAFVGLDYFLREHILPELHGGSEGMDSAPDLPGSLILMGFQYAMADDILFNAILFHELGHHIFRQKVLHDGTYAPALKSEVRERLERDVAGYRNATNQSQKEKVLSTAHAITLGWVNELFSDVFAAALAGPQFAFAARDLFRLRGSEARPESFGRTHPANHLRETEQHQVLAALGWFSPEQFVELPGSEFKDLALSVFGYLNPSPSMVIGTQNAPSWRYDDLAKVGISEDVAGILVDITMKRCAAIRRLAIAQIPDAGDRCKEFWWLGQAVAEAFNHAIVPSTLITDFKADIRNHRKPGETVVGDHSGTTFCYYPQPTTVMNVARVLYQSGCTTLHKKWNEGQSGVGGMHENLLHVHMRLSQWTQKAIGDWLLLIKGESK